MTKSEKKVVWGCLGLLSLIFLPGIFGVLEFLWGTAFPPIKDFEGGEVARQFGKQFGLPVDLVSSMNEFRLRKTGPFGKEQFYSFKAPSNQVEKFVQKFGIDERYEKDWRKPNSPYLPPWWNAIKKEWPTNAVYYWKPHHNYELWYLPDSEQCLFHWP